MAATEGPAHLEAAASAEVSGDLVGVWVADSVEGAQAEDGNRKTKFQE